MRFFVSILILLTSMNAWSREIRICDQGDGDFSGKTGLVILDLVVAGELSLAVKDKESEIGSYNRFIIDGQTLEISNWEGQEVEASATYDKATNTISGEFITPNGTLSGAFNHCVLENQ